MDPRLSPLRAHSGSWLTHSRPRSTAPSLRTLVVLLLLLWTLTLWLLLLHTLILLPRLLSLLLLLLMCVLVFFLLRCCCSCQQCCSSIYNCLYTRGQVGRSSASHVKGIFLAVGYLMNVLCVFDQHTDCGRLSRYCSFLTSDVTA